ncbi:C39 family peptidase [Phycisphaera mikurensis]|uniref:Peptidase C39-like domain-containing protein n=1 Tax=Phycisphaera mikurensis (strain NBRC 102666 / KCTC 22515 / FYK2301M01) TaxID=1142394 RepID=I0IHW7_PHYMF|nr:C39 family peptidase [Phycisphaera mikurensis]BAM04855.1 hypothetical protein PSMK_26960 [Phycisphaera mikurensis NBRC 102666]
MPLDPGVDRLLLAVEPRGALDDATLQLAVRRAGVWSPWMAVLGPGEAAADRDAVEVDVLRLGSPAEAVRVRSGGLGSVTLGGAGPVRHFGDAAAAGVVAHAVPFLTQRSLPEPMAGRTCCPTSLAMVLGFHGLPRPLPRVAAAVRDPRHDLYGNWLRAAAVATAAGRPAVVRQARSWSVLAGWLRASGPVIASIAYEEGGLPGAVMPQTEGHLLVITGLDGAGGVRVHDPAGVSGEGLTLDAGAFERAWAPHGAVAIVVGARRAGPGA